MAFTYNQRIALIAGFLLTFFFLVFGGVSYYQMKSYLQQEMTAKQLSRMKALQMDINGWMRPSMRLVDELKKELEGYAVYNKEEIVPLLARAKKNINSVQVYFGLEDGRMMYDSGKELRMDWYDPRTRPWYMKGMESEEISISTPFVGFASNQFTLTIMAPIVKEGKKQGVVAASFYVNKLYRKIKALPLDEGYAFIVDAEGKIIMHPDKTMVNVSFKEFAPLVFEQMHIQKEGVTEHAKELISFGKLHNGWFAIVALNKEHAYAFSESMVKLFCVMGALMVILTVIILLKMSSKVEQ